MIRQPVGTLTALGAAFLLTACAPAPPPDTTAEDTAAINQLRSDWTEAYNAGDIDGLVAMYADDYVDYPNNAPSTSGRAGARVKLEAQLTGMTASTVVTSEELQLLGDHAFDRGTFKATLVPDAGGDPVLVDGRYFVILRREADGSWRIARSVDNTPVPLEGMGG